MTPSSERRGSRPSQFRSCPSWGTLGGSPQTLPKLWSTVILTQKSSNCTTNPRPCCIGRTRTALCLETQATSVHNGSLVSMEVSAMIPYLMSCSHTHPTPHLTSAHSSHLSHLPHLIPTSLPSLTPPHTSLPPHYHLPTPKYQLNHTSLHLTTTSLPPSHTSIPPHYHLPTPQYHLTTTSPHLTTTSLPPPHTSLPPHYHLPTPQYHLTTTSPHLTTTSLPPPHTSLPPHYHLPHHSQMYLSIPHLASPNLT